MNKIFKHVTNAKNGQLVSAVAAETARTGGRTAASAGAERSVRRGWDLARAFLLAELDEGA
jgi:hypothetical protein